MGKGKRIQNSKRNTREVEEQLQNTQSFNLWFRLWWWEIWKAFEQWRIRTGNTGKEIAMQNIFKPLLKTASSLKLWIMFSLTKNYWKKFDEVLCIIEYLQKLPFNSTLGSLQSFSKVIVWLYNRHIPNRCNSADSQTRHGFWSCTRALHSCNF